MSDSESSASRSTAVGVRSQPTACPSAADMQDSDDNPSGNTNAKRPRSPTHSMQNEAHVAEAVQTHDTNAAQQQQADDQQHAQEKKRKTSAYEQPNVSSQQHSDSNRQSLQQEATPSHTASHYTGSHPSTPLLHSTTSASATSASASYCASSSSLHAQSTGASTGVGVRKLVSGVSSAFSNFPLEAMNNRTSAEWLISSTGNTNSSSSASSSTASTPTFNSSSSSSSSSSTFSLKAAEESYYELLAAFLQHFDRNDSALVWLSRALPTRSNKLAVPKTCRNPKSAGGNGGYADAFKKLGLTLKESDTRSGHWHCWYVDPFSTNFRALQSALKRRWVESPNYSLSAAELCKTVDENLRTRMMPLRRQSQPNIPPHAKQFYPPTPPEKQTNNFMPYAALATSNHMHSHSHGNYSYLLPSAYTQGHQSPNMYPMAVPMQMHALPVSMYARQQYLNPYSAAHVHAPSSTIPMHMYATVPSAAWQGSNYALATDVGTAQTAMEGQYSIDFSSQQTIPARLPQHGNAHAPAEQSILVSSLPDSTALPSTHQHLPQVQAHHLHGAYPLSAPVRSSSDSAEHAALRHPHSNSAQIASRSSHVTAWSNTNPHMYGSMMQPHTLTVNPTYIHSESSSSPNTLPYDGSPHSSASSDYPQTVHSHPTPAPALSVPTSSISLMQQPLALVSDSQRLSEPSLAVTAPVRGNQLRRFRSHRPALSASSSLAEESAIAAYPHNGVEDSSS